MWRFHFHLFSVYSVVFDSKRWYALFDRVGGSNFLKFIDSKVLLWYDKTDFWFNYIYFRHFYCKEWEREDKRGWLGEELPANDLSTPNFLIESRLIQPVSNSNYQKQIGRTKVINSFTQIILKWHESINEMIKSDKITNRMTAKYKRQAILFEAKAMNANMPK